MRLLHRPAALLIASAWAGCGGHAGSDAVTLEFRPDVAVGEEAYVCFGFDAQAVRGVRGQIQVRTEFYAYHVMIRTPSGTRDLFRYDNVHAHLGHADAHHKHLYNADGREVLPRRHVGAAGAPDLGSVIGEAYAWIERQKAGGIGR